MPPSDTIYAFATPPGRSGVAVLRISGCRAAEILKRVTNKPVAPRRASTRTLVHVVTREPIDQALVLWMPGPTSFTGDDVLELHVHGGSAIRSSLLVMLAQIEGLRPAKPGEFVRRAFMAGRLDLTEAEGLADLIEAETEAQRRQALFQAGGGLRGRLEEWREDLLSASSLLEVSLDFSDEDLPDDLAAQCDALLADVEREMKAALANARGGEIVRDGFRVALTGPPNAGKSTLLNRLAQRDLAIVSPVPGTTRDVIEARCDVGGYLVIFSDTAGLRDSDDPVERIGIDRARDVANSADLVLVLADASHEPQTDAPQVSAGRSFSVWTKIDAAPPDLVLPPGVLAISAQTGEGMNMLMSRITAEIEARTGAPDALMVQVHQVHAIGKAADALARARDVLRTRHDVLAAEDVRIALQAVATVSGRAGVEDVLDRVFGRFCIGK